MSDILSILFRSLKPDTGVLRSMLLRILVLLFVLCISSVIASLGLGFMIWSCYLYLKTSFDPYQAALMSGALAVVVAVLIALIAGLSMGYFKGKKSAPFKAAAPQPSPIPDPEALIKRYPLESGIIAAAAGFIAGSSSDTPRTLTELIMLIKDSGIR